MVGQKATNACTMFAPLRRKNNPPKKRKGEIFMSQMPSDGLEFTDSALRSMQETVNDLYFRDRDAELIYQTLEYRLRAIPFCKYLKRYIYKKAGLQGNFEEIPIKEYQLIIRNAFLDSQTPPSFSHVSSKLSALSKNWLSQHTVKRSVVFLLGFGLHMTVDEVNEFLIKALREPGINCTDPFELLCWYCYRNDFNYPIFEKLWNRYQAMPANPKTLNIRSVEQIAQFRKNAVMICDETALLDALAKLKTPNNVSTVNVIARKHFNRIYDRARELIAVLYNESEEEKSSLTLERYRTKMEHNDRLSDETKRQRIEKKKAETRRISPKDITAGDIEHVICSAIPTDRHGNLLPIRISKFNNHFHGKKFSRQHISDILAGLAEVDRFDLITLQFFIYSQTTDRFPDSKARYTDFVDTTNEVLRDCGMGQLYVANPYECFILMCLLADDPLGTYADVWEMAYESDLQEL